MKFELSKIINSKINYLNLSINLVLYIFTMLLLYLLETLFFWGVFGEGAYSDKISNLWYVELFLDYFPLVLLIGILVFKTLININIENFSKAKINCIIIIFLIFSFIFRNSINSFFY